MDEVKVQPDGIWVGPPPIARTALLVVGVIFKLAGWVLVMVAFDYVGMHFGSIAANAVSFVLGCALGVYVSVGVVTLAYNLSQRLVVNPFKGWWAGLFWGAVLPGFASAAMVFLSHAVVGQMVAAHP